MLIGNYLFGTTFDGGLFNNGIVFKLSTDGRDFAVLHDFQGDEGAGLWSGLLLLSNRLYGTTTTGANQNNGTIFRLSLPGPVPTAFIHSADNLVVTWPTNSTGLVLQSSADLSAWTAISATPQIVNGSYAVTNSISGQCRFFRLSR